MPFALCTDANLNVKYVLFNNSAVDWWMSPNTPNSNWVSWPVHQPLAAFNPDVPTGEDGLARYTCMSGWRQTNPDTSHQPRRYDR